MNKNIFSYFVFLISMLVLSSCQHDDFDKQEPSGNIREFSFEITLPGFSIPESTSLRSMPVKESAVEKIYVLLFEIESSGNEKLIYKTKATNINQVSNNKVTFKSKLQEGTNINVVLIANPDNGASTLLDANIVGVDKALLLGTLIISNTGKWTADESSPTGYTPIPMYGETGSKNITGATGTIDNIKLRRMLAKIDISSTTNDFELESVYLCNYNSSGYLSPEWTVPNGTVSMATPTLPNVFSNPQLGVVNALEYTVLSNSLTSEIYTFEANAANETTPKDASCLVVKGKYNNTDYYYRIDFTYSSGANKGKYMPLLRNHKYDVKIISAEGIGYASLKDALNSFTVESNLRTQIMSYDESDMQDINFNGQYYLAMSDDSALAQEDGLFLDESGTVILPPAQFTIQTDYPGGIRLVNITSEEAGDNSTSISWVSLLSSPNISAGSKETVSLSINPLGPSDGDIRVAYVNFQAGRLRASFEIIQTKTSLIRSTSNCYMVKPGSSPILIPVIRAEEGIPGSLSRRNILDKEFIWTDNSNGISASGAVSDAKVYGKGRKAVLWVKPGSAEGNAVVAVKDENNTIKWSWHMWVTNYVPSGNIMDRNLGALSSSYTPVSEWWKTRGLFYQWGRKDPFPNMYKTTGGHFPLYYYDKNGNEVLSLPSGNYGDLRASVEVPLKFFSEGALSNTSWAGSIGDDSWGYNSSGNNKKSVYDPSPEGWKVPNDASAFQYSSFVQIAPPIGRWWQDTPPNDSGTAYLNPNYNGGHIAPISGTGTFYPAAGMATFGKNSKLVVNNSVAKYGLFWTARPKGSSIYNAYVLTVTEIGKGQEEKNKDRGYSVRSVKE